MTTGSMSDRATAVDRTSTAATGTAPTPLHPLALLSTAGLGAAIMYFLDPARGNRRRRLVADQFVHAQHVTGDAVGATARDLKNRARGAVVSAQARFIRSAVDDIVLIGRIRSKLGRLVSYPGTITVDVRDGWVTLSGLVLTGEMDTLLSGVRTVPGVRDVENHLKIRQSREHVPGMQGAARHTRGHPALLREHWTPAERVINGGIGTVLTLYGARRKNTFGILLGLTGVALTMRSLTNTPVKRLVGIPGQQRSVDVQKTITINAPVERVFQVFTAWENWPRWMSHVREVQHTGTDGGQPRTHWVVDGPAWTTMEWDAIVTQLVPNKALAWKSADRAEVEHAGVIHFTPTTSGTTIDVKMSYNPPAGAMGHAVAALFGRDPRHQMDDDLARLKVMIETGTPPHDATRPAPSDVTPGADSMEASSGR